MTSASTDTPGSAGSTDLEVDDLVARAYAQAEAGDPHGAIALLTGANRQARHPRFEIALAELRHTGYLLEHAPTNASVPADRPPTGSSRMPASDPVALDHTPEGLPFISADELDGAHLRAALDERGCLYVPALLPPETVDRLITCIDQTFDDFDRWRADPGAARDEEAEASFTPIQPVPPYKGIEHGSRSWTRRGGGVWTADSPRMLFEVTELLDQLGIGRLVADYLGEPPALSASKCNLRRMEVDLRGGWHQDGSFLGYETSSMNLWIALTDCGRDAPGLDIVPERLDHIVEIPEEAFSLSAQQVADEVERLGTEIVSPEFSAGDALLFDHLFLHQTAVAPGMTRPRYALETWFFGPTHFPREQIPLLY